MCILHCLGAKLIKDNAEQSMNYPSAWLYHQVRNTLPPHQADRTPALTIATRATNQATRATSHPTKQPSNQPCHQTCQGKKIAANKQGKYEHNIMSTL